MLLIIADRCLANGFSVKRSESDQKTVKSKNGKTKKQQHTILLLMETSID